MLVAHEVCAARSACSAVGVGVEVGGGAVVDADVGVGVVIWVGGTHRDAAVG